MKKEKNHRHSSLHIEIPPSKTKIKKEMLRLQKLGQSLLNIPPTELKSLGLDEQLIDAIILTKKIKTNEGNRRQIQFIGKLMRRLDNKIVKNLFEYTKNSHKIQTI